jgi:hypothetical protein
MNEQNVNYGEDNFEISIFQGEGSRTDDFDSQLVSEGLGSGQFDENANSSNSDPANYGEGNFSSVLELEI